MKKSQKHSKIYPLLLAVIMLFVGPALVNAQGLEIQKIPSSSFANPGTTIEVISRVTNTGTENISGIVVQDAWPANYMINGVVTSSNVWQVENLAGGESQSQVYQVAIPEDAVLGRHSLTSKATSKNPLQEKNLEYSLEVRQVLVDAIEVEAIPVAGGIRKVDIIGFILFIQLLVISVTAFNLAKTYRYES